MGLKRNILNNGIATGLQKGVRALEQLLLVPFFISSWGAAYYGEWLTLTIIPSVLALSDLGFGTAAANRFVLQYASGDRRGAADISYTGIIIISFAVLLGIVLSASILFAGGFLGWFAKSLIPLHDAVLALIFMMAARLISFYNGLFGANFIAARKAALGINLSTVGSILQVIAGVAVLLLDGTVVQYALWQLIVSVVFNAAYWRWAVLTLGLNKEHKGSYNKSFAKEIFSKGFGYLMFPGWQAIFFQGTTFVVRLILGPIAVTVFNTVRTLTRSLNQVFSMVNGSVFPELQFELGADNKNKSQRMFIYAVRTSVVLAVGGVFFLAIFGLPIYNWWTHNALILPHAMWYLFLAGLLLNAIWWTTEMVYRAMNKPYLLSIPAIITAAISVVFSYFCCKLWGLTGAAIGSLIFDVIMLFWIFPKSCKLMGQPVKRIFKSNNSKIKKNISL